MVRAMRSESLQAVISQVLLKRTGGGRVAAHEIMVGTPAVRNLIRENKVPQIVSMLQTGHRFGMQTMRDCIQRLVSEGAVSESELDRFKINFGENEPTGRDAPGAGELHPPPQAPAAPAQADATAGDAPRKGLLRGRF